MPEMPEMQAHAERLAAAVQGHRLTAFKLLNFAALKTYQPAADDAVGRSLTQVRRRGKYLIFDFDCGISHVVHLMQGGRLRMDPKPSKKPRHGLARWVFAPTPDTAASLDTAEAPDPAAATNSGRAAGTGAAAHHDQAWLLTEAGTERKAGVWAATTTELAEASNPRNPLGHLGPDADQISRQQLGEILAGHSKRIHGVLRDQTILAGLGRMLANEILYEAALSPFANAAKLGSDELDRLHMYMGQVIDRATEHERTLDDIGKSIDRPSKVHNRQDQPCLDCDDTVRAVTFRSYTIYYCPRRQTGGKRLADNTTSRFLK